MSQLTFASLLTPPAAPPVVVPTPAMAPIVMPAPVAVPVTVAVPATISHNGEFTIASPKGGHRTFRIKTVKHGSLKGKRILALLNGPDNTTSYVGFAFVNKTATGFDVWNRYKKNPFSTGTDWEFYATMLAEMILKGDESIFVAKGYRLLSSTRCRVCNRLLTHPNSIDSGIGPECELKEAGL